MGSIPSPALLSQVGMYPVFSNTPCWAMCPPQHIRPVDLGMAPPPRRTRSVVVLLKLCRGHMLLAEIWNDAEKEWQPGNKAGIYHPVPLSDLILQVSSAAQGDKSPFLLHV